MHLTGGIASGHGRFLTIKRTWRARSLLAKTTTIFRRIFFSIDFINTFLGQAQTDEFGGCVSDPALEQSGQMRLIEIAKFVNRVGN
jgi:hypothetical protein